MDLDSFIIHIKTEGFYKNIANDVEKWFDKCNCDENAKRTKKCVIKRRLMVKHCKDCLFNNKNNIKIATKIIKVYTLKKSIRLQ